MKTETDKFIDAVTLDSHSYRGIEMSFAEPVPLAFAFDIDIDMLVKDSTFVAGFLNALADKIHADNVASGWWTDIRTGESILHTRNVPEMLCLIHSEISEAMEGYRKSSMDDKLPHRPMMQTELADAMIRIFDLAGSRAAIELATGRVPDLCNPIGDIVEEKRAFNRTRADHAITNRRKDGGKAF